MTKKETEKKLNEAIELLELVHRNLMMGAEVCNGRIILLEHTSYKNMVYNFVKSVNPDTRLKFSPVADFTQLLA